MSRAVWVESDRLVTPSSDVRFEILVSAWVLFSRHFLESECHEVCLQIATSLANFQITADAG
jgi:hypothetical protein